MKATVLKFFFSILTLLTLQISCQTEKTNNEGDDNNQVNTEQETPDKMIESLVGEWKIDRILSGDQEVTDAEGGSDQTLTFTNEARYIRRAGTQMADSGAYRMNEQLKNLYFESEINEQPEEWEVTFKSDTLILSRTKDSTKGNLQYVYTRSPATTTDN